MWIAVVIGLLGGFIIGAIFGVLYMEQANNECKSKINDLEKALRDSKAPYEILARDKQEVKYDDNTWW